MAIVATARLRERSRDDELERERSNDDEIGDEI